MPVTAYFQNEQVKTLAVTALVVVFGLEVLYLSQRVDAYGLIESGQAVGWKALFGYTGKVAQVAVLALFMLVVITHQRITAYWHELMSHFNWLRCILGGGLWLGSYALLYFLSVRVFESDNVLGHWMLLWLVVTLVWLLTFVYTLMGRSFAIRLCVMEWRSIALAVSVALVVWSLAMLTKNLWGPLSDLTFILVVLTLMLTDGENVYADFDARDIGLSEFTVNVAPACSGFEGIGLVCAFTAIFLYVYKAEFRFPRALLLFPIGALLIWLLNVLRITMLILIGEYWSADVAVGGFHSQAGWLTFIVSSLALLWFARTRPFFSVGPRLSGVSNHSNSSGVDAINAAELNMHEQNRLVRSSDDIEQANSASDMAIASLLPLVVLLASVLITGVLTADFVWLYPLRVISVVAALYYLRSSLAVLFAGCTFHSFVLTRRFVESVLAGIVVAGIWAVMLVGESVDSNAEFTHNLFSHGAWVAGAWLLFRVLGAAITVPIAEELAFRGYVLSKLSGVDVHLKGRLPISVIAIALSSIAFGLLHGAWLEGAIAGLVYATVRLRTQHIAYAVISHAVTNALLFVVAAGWGEWSLL